MRLVRVNMTDRTITVTGVPPEYAGLGGRGLTSIMLNAEVPPRCDPLGPENKLIFAPGLLSGTPLPNSGRLSVGAKSPLTGTIKESNVGGTVATALGHLGITALVVEGQAPQGELYLLCVDEKGNCALVPAGEFKRMRTYAFVGRMLETYGEKNGVLCIGPAGEYGMKVASIQAADVDGRPCRAAGRGGLGAVMGSKGLKGLIVDLRGKNADAVADPDGFREAIKPIVQFVKQDHMSGQVMPKFGTASLVGAVNSIGAFPSYNARKGVLDGWEKISGEAMAELIEQRGGKTMHMGCSQCMIHCSNEFVDKEGKYVTSSLEYETMWAMGGMTGVADLDMIARLDHLCDDIGIDTMSTGVGIAVAMDAGYRRFGDAAAVIELVEEIGNGTEFGRILGNGPAAVGKHLGHERVPVVKGQSIAAYDPRSLLGHGVTYATSPMGADHTAGNLIGAYLDLVLDPLKTEGQVEMSRFLQITMAAFDSTGQCFMANVALLSPQAGEAFATLMSAKLGKPFGPADLYDLGVRVLRAEKEFNRKAGFTKEDDRLPRFFYQEPLPPHNTVYAINAEEIDKTFDF